MAKDGTALREGLRVVVVGDQLSGPLGSFVGWEGYLTKRDGRFWLVKFAKDPPEWPAVGFLEDELELA